VQLRIIRIAWFNYNFTCVYVYEHASEHEHASEQTGNKPGTNREQIKKNKRWINQKNKPWTS